MRGKKPYNIRNLEAHINSITPLEQTIYSSPNQFLNNIGRNIVFQTSVSNVIQPSE